jgi:hypothetical protein
VAGPVGVLPRRRGRSPLLWWCTSRTE